MTTKPKKSDLIKENKELKVINDGYKKIIDEAFKLIKSLNNENKMLRAAILNDDIDFPNSKERRQGDTETPNNISEF